MEHEMNDGLPTRELGRTGLRVTPLSIGCAALGNMPDTFAFEVGEERALSTLRAVFEGPINFVDTAAAYGDGESERRIGVVLRERGGLPDGFVLATKADRNLETGDFSGDQIRRSIERSLKLLGLDRLQLVHLHDPEHTTFEAAMRPGGPVEVLLGFKEQGIIEHVGVAGGPIDMMTRYVETGLFETAISHNRYTLLNTAAGPFWDACRERGVAAINAAPYGSGILAKGPSAYPRYAYQDAGGDIVDRARALEDICRRFDVPLPAAALQFSLRDDHIVSTVVGISEPDRLQGTLEYARYPIPAELWQALAAVEPDTQDPERDRFR
jgi:D-threo-aldose 1-dehydrogenase